MGRFGLSIFALLLSTQLFLNSTFLEAQSLRLLSEDNTSKTYRLSASSPMSIQPFEFVIAGTQNIEILTIETFQISEEEIASSTEVLRLFDEGQFIVYGQPLNQQEQIVKDVFVFPIIKSGNDYLGIKNLVFKIPKQSITTQRARKANFTNRIENLSAPFQEGNWVKIPISQDGIYQIDGAYLAEAGLTVNGISANDLVILGAQGRMLPMQNALIRPSMDRIPVLEASGSGESIQLRFYANGPSGTTISNNGTISHQQHYYSNRAYVFVGTSSSLEPLNVSEINLQGGTPLSNGLQLVWKDEEFFKPEEDLKSGMNWLGQRFTRDATGQRQDLLNLQLPSLTEATDVDIRIRMVGRSLNTERVNFFLNNETLGQSTLNRIFSYTAADGPSARFRDFRSNVQLNSPSGDLRIEAETALSLSSAEAWLDYIEVQFSGLLQPLDGRLEFYAPTNTSTLREYELGGFTQTPTVLDVTNPQRPLSHTVIESNGQYLFSANYKVGQRFIVQENPIIPEPASRIENQSIFAEANFPRLLIITNNRLLSSAQAFADYRNTTDPDLRAHVVTQEAIFNRLNSGTADAVAIRDYIIELQNRAQNTSFPEVEYLLFYGDATYDPKAINTEATLENEVITFQTVESLDRIRSYGTDDFFGLLDPNEGPMQNQLERVDIGIGRLPVNSPREGQVILDKIKVYENPSSFGSWRLNFTFLADDELNGSENDGDLHVLNADGTAIRMDIENTGIQFNKIYLPSYPVVTTAEGRRVPGAKNDLIRSINNGSLVVNYSGHGAEQVLSAERVFRSEDIQSLSNKDRPTIFVTATCSFGRYDDDLEQSGAEKLVLYDDGGAVASFTTTRVVYTSSSTVGANNFSLNILLSRNMIERDSEGKAPRLGDIYKKTKATSTGSAVNSRKFILLGDPSMRIGLSAQEDKPTSVNTISLSSDTAFVKALDPVQIRGEILTPSNTVDSNFNGEAEIIVYDASRPVRMLERVEEERSCLLEDCTYEVQNDVLYRGRVSISNGQYQSEFIVPRDIQNTSDLGRIIVYAIDLENNRTSAGSSENVIFNGLNTNASEDAEGPQIDAWLNSPLFADGTIVGTNPTLFIELEDPSGINTTGAGIGHELSAQLNTSPPIDYELNRFYTGSLDQFEKGNVEFPLNDLPEGEHELTIRAWDVYNNLSEQRLSFEVIDNGSLVVRNLYNYPNPMNNFTRFVFEHNQSGQPLNIDIRVYTLSGRPVTKIQKELIPNDSYAIIEWDGKDIDGNRLANGTYLYHTRIKTQVNGNSDTYEKTEKLVIIR